MRKPRNLHNEPHDQSTITTNYNPGLLSMEVRKWEVTQLNKNSSLKRSWDRSSSRIETLTTLGGFNREQKHSEIQQWKKRPSSPPKINPSQDPSAWDVSLKTSIWIAQQDSLVSGTMSRREPANLLSSQTGQWEHTVQKDDAIPPDQGRGFLRYNDDEKSDLDRRKPIINFPANLDDAYNKTPTQMAFGAGRTRETVTPKIEREASLDSNCGRCRESTTLLKDSLENLNELASSLTSGAWLEIHKKMYSNGVAHNQMPQVSNIHRIFDLLEEANQVSKRVLTDASTYLPRFESPRNDTAVGEHASSLQAMKRRFLADTQDVLKRQRRDDSMTDLNYQTVTDNDSNSSGLRGHIITANNDRLPPIRTHTSSHHTTNSLGIKLPSMNPPPAPTANLINARQHPSPPASYTRTLSPSPLTFPSSSHTPASNSNNSHQSPKSPSPSTTSAPDPTIAIGSSLAATIAAHTAGLQHTVSLKSYALQSLQAEHDKLLAALSRSQTRARTLEEKSSMTDTELSMLSEERMRLIEKISELETSLVEVARARDEARTNAVDEGRQYVEIVRMATRLEEIGREERALHALSIQNSTRGTSCPNPQPLSAIALSISADSKSAKELEAEILVLRNRCVEYESALLSIRTEGRRIDEVIAALGSASARVGKSLDTVIGR